MKHYEIIALGLITLAIMCWSAWTILKIMLPDVTASIRTKAWRRAWASGLLQVVIGTSTAVLLPGAAGLACSRYGYTPVTVLSLVVAIILVVSWLVFVFKGLEKSEASGIVTKDFDAFVQPYRDNPTILNDLAEVVRRRKSFGRFYLNIASRPDDVNSIYGGRGHALVFKDLDDLDLFARYLAEEFPKFAKA